MRKWLFSGVSSVSQAYGRYVYTKLSRSRVSFILFYIELSRSRPFCFMSVENHLYQEYQE